MVLTSTFACFICFLLGVINFQFRFKTGSQQEFYLSLGLIAYRLFKILFTLMSGYRHQRCRGSQVIIHQSLNTQGIICIVPYPTSKHTAVYKLFLGSTSPYYCTNLAFFDRQTSKSTKIILLNNWP